MAVLKLESPFKELWKRGYLVINKEPRRNVVLYNSQEDRTTISYAKYLMSIKLGRILKEYEIVDHINDDTMDDRIDNYQIISKRDNNLKSIIQKGKSGLYVRFKCGVCGKIFDKRKNITHLVYTSKRSDYCSRSCGGKSPKFPESEVILEFRKSEELENVLVPLS